MTESQLQEWFRRAAVEAGWLWYHTQDSRGCAAGFPDVVAVPPAGNGPTWFLEFKSASGRLRPEQKVWQERLIASGARYSLVTPALAAVVARAMGLVPLLPDDTGRPPADLTGLQPRAHQRAVEAVRRDEEARRKRHGDDR